MPDAEAYRHAYDVQLRTDVETPGAVEVTQLGPLRLVHFAGGRGFVTYRNLGGADAATVEGLVEQAVVHYRDDPSIERVEWKTRGHDHAPGLHDALLRHGFEPEEPESIMIGEAKLLAVDVVLPPGIELRQVTAEGDVRAMTAMQSEAFGEPIADESVDAMLRRLASVDGAQAWVAEAEGQIVSAGRLEPVRGTAFAGIWGGATRPAWRRQGIYRALTAARFVRASGC